MELNRINIKQLDYKLEISIEQLYYKPDFSMSR